MTALTSLLWVCLMAFTIGSIVHGARPSKHQDNVDSLMKAAPARLLNSPVHSIRASVERNGVYHDMDEPLRKTVTQYGGDPTGRNDSTAAVKAAVQACVDQSLLSPNGVFPGTFSFGNGKSIRDAGGCMVDLDGGEFKVSSPITIPEYVANMNFGFGSIVASETFPTDGFLIVIGIQGSCKVPQGSCNLDINFPSLFLDGANRAAGCMEINNVMGVTVGPGGYLLNFTSYGVQINGGHEVMIDRCWLGETNFDYNFKARNDHPNATAIQINGNDHYVLNTVVFSSKIGVEVNGAADYINGVHVWFPDNIALAFNDTKAFAINDGGNRFFGCYIDGSRAVFQGSGTSRNVWTGGFECCAAIGGVPHGIVLLGSSIGPGLTITGNEFGGGSIFVNPDDPATAVTVKGVSIRDNSFPHDGHASIVTMSLTQKNAAVWNFDFCDLLVVPVINNLQFSVQAESGFPVVVARAPDGCKVMIESSEAFSGTITATADISTYDATYV